MAFPRRMAALAAVVLIPLGIAATSFALTDRPDPPRIPAEVRLDSASPTPSPGRSDPPPHDEVVSRPPVTDGPADDDADDGSRPSGDDTDDNTDDQNDTDDRDDQNDRDDRDDTDDGPGDDG